MLRRSRHRRGFTLIELMIVVAIIGVLAAIAIPKFASLIAKSQEGAAKGALGSIRSAVSIYYGDMEGKYPADITTGLTSAMALLPGLPSAVLPSPAGHSANNVEGQAGSVNTCPPGMADLANTQIWYYFPDYTPQPNSACAGNVYIHCTHTDSKGSLWSNY
jgi:prepilin-type N-terminal cleavage/methylation domain-containing protein